jgi:Transcriptional cell cycle regulator TrcR
LGSVELFELPIEDRRHQQLRDDAWIGGPFFEGRYYLGWFRRTNEFRHNHEEFDEDIAQTIRDQLPQSSWIAESSYRVEFLLKWLKHKYRESDEGRRYPIPKQTREERAIVLLLENPELTDDEIRQIIGTTEKTIERWASYKLARRERNRLIVRTT